MPESPNLAASGSTNWVFRYQGSTRIPAIIFQDKQWYDVWITLSDGRIVKVAETYLRRGADIVELVENDFFLSITYYKAWPWKQAIASTSILKDDYTKIKGRQEVLPS